MYQIRKADLMKANLLWEAVRRNEYYWKYFQSAKSQSHDESVSKYKGIDTWPHQPRWKLNKVYDPTLEVNEIESQINSGEDPNDVHPYYHLFQKREMSPALIHEVPGSMYNFKTTQSYHDFFEGDNKAILCIKKAGIADRVVVSFDPLTKDKELFNAIKAIKNISLENRRDYVSAEGQRFKSTLKMELNDLENPTEDDDSRSTMKTNIKFTCFMRDIPDYIRWLQKYDEIIGYCRTKKRENPDAVEFSLLIQNGVRVVTSKFSFKHMVSNEFYDKPREYDIERRKWEIYYEGAVRLIHVAPNIVFSSSKKS